MCDDWLISLESKTRLQWNTFSIDQALQEHNLTLQVCKNPFWINLQDSVHCEDVRVFDSRRQSLFVFACACVCECARVYMRACASMLCCAQFALLVFVGAHAGIPDRIVALSYRSWIQIFGNHYDQVMRENEWMFECMCARTCVVASLHLSFRHFGVCSKLKLTKVKLTKLRLTKLKLTKPRLTKLRPTKLKLTKLRLTKLKLNETQTYETWTHETQTYET